MPYEKSKIDLPDGFIDLGESINSLDLASPVERSEYHYPSLYFDNAEGLASLPKEGTATIYFKKVMERKETINRNGKIEKRHTVELCICGINPDGESSESEYEEEDDDEDEIEKGLEEAEQETSKPKIEIET
jgi:hypothetical protein